MNDARASVAESISKIKKAQKRISRSIADIRFSVHVVISMVWELESRFGKNQVAFHKV